MNRAFDEIKKHLGFGMMRLPMKDGDIDNEAVCAMVDRFLERGFTHLQLCFGCTGGQHRSVYCACAVGKHLKEKFPQTVVKVTHREME